MFLQGKISWRKPLVLGLILTGLGGILLLAGLFGVGIVTWERHQGYYGPALSTDGQQVWFFQRKAGGLALGMGWEHFTPPARVFLLRDELSLCRYDRQSGQVETLLHWPGTPLIGQKLKHYRGRILGLPAAKIRWQANHQVEYAARMTLLRVPRSTYWSIQGSWNGPDSVKPEWQPTDTSMSGLSEPIVAGPLEVMALRGEEGFPAAIVLLDHSQRQVEVLEHNKSYGRIYPNGVRFDNLLEFSRKTELDRLDEMRKTRQELIAKFKKQGLKEGAALLAAGREMARLGWWPTPAQVTAREVAAFPDGLRIFTIDPHQLRVGLFSDLKQAMAAPGEPVDFHGRYIRHRDYTTSEELNAFLATKPEVFGVRIDGRNWLMTITPPKPPSR